MDRDGLAEIIYAAWLTTEWLTTVDGTPSSAAYYMADEINAHFETEAGLGEVFESGDEFLASLDAPDRGDAG